MERVDCLTITRRAMLVEELAHTRRGLIVGIVAEEG